MCCGRDLACLVASAGQTGHSSEPVAARLDVWTSVSALWKQGQ